MQSIQWHIGCSGFHYKEWKDLFYPKGLASSKWFSFYALHFNTLELNVTFYRFPELNALQGWYDKAPPGFVFSAKVPRSVTHYKKFVGSGGEIADFYAVLREGLKEKLGCVLFQLPPQFTYTEERLQLLLESVDVSFDNVVELRDASWWRNDVTAQLGQKEISFCGVSFPGIPHEEAIATSSIAYYRFHGVPKLFYSEYEPSFLQKTVEELHAHRGVKKAFLYFNNTASGAALTNARWVQQYLQGLQGNPGRA